LKASKGISFLVIGLSYIIAIFCGIITYRFLGNQTLWLRIFGADVVATITIFLISCFFRNASIYDPYWSVTPLIVLSLLLINEKTFNIFNIVLLIVVSFWSIRLTSNWAYTFKNLEYQDWRYDMLKKRSGKFYPLINLVGIQLFPTLIVFGCMLSPILFIGNNVAGEFSHSIFKIIVFIVGCSLSIFAIFLQLFSDIQMQRFRNNPQNKGKFISIGLWKYSRHPNYLGEILMWWGLFIATQFTSTWILFIGPLLNTLMFLFISIPMAENRLKGYKNGFEEYEARTRMLLPLIKK
jgi:steroid 5-alpha reductase family enzyme